MLLIEDKLIFRPFNPSKKLFYFVLLPFVLLYAIYTPVGLTFGAPSYQYIASVFATDLLESKDGEKVLFEMSDKELMELLS